MSNNLGEKIRSLRKEQKLTLEALALNAKLSKSYLWELENREAQKPSAEKLSAIAKVLGVSLDYFLENDIREPDEKHLDDAFFRNYQNLGSAEKEHIRNIMQVFQKKN